jgi:hypothetical protein
MGYQRGRRAIFLDAPNTSPHTECVDHWEVGCYPERRSREAFSLLSE